LLDTKFKLCFSCLQPIAAAVEAGIALTQIVHIQLASAPCLLELLPS
jgi:hypothetical protein